MAHRKNIYVDNLADARRLVNISQAAKTFGHGFTVFNIAAGADEVYQTYQKGGDWQRKAVGVSAEAILVGRSAMAASDLAMGFMEGSLCLTPVGWVAIAISAAITGLVAATLSPEIERAAEDIFNWAKHYAERWF